MKNGFTLIEILISTLVFSVALMAIAFSLSRGSGLASEIKESSIAAHALQEQMELIRRTNFNNILAAYFPSANFNAAGFNFLNNALGTITVDYPYGTSSPDDMIIRVTVTVSWTSVSGRQKQRSMVTLVTSDGISG